MPKEKPQQPRQTPPSPIQAERDINERGGVVKDAELAEAAGGARPSPEPTPRPTGPVNRAADLTGSVADGALKEGLLEAQPEITPAPPAPPPPSESDGGKA